MEANQQEVDQIEWEGGDQSSLQPDALAIQQLLNSDSMPNGIGPGEVMYVMVGSTTYQITGPQEAGGEITIAPVTNVEDLANIGALPEDAGQAEADGENNAQPETQASEQETSQDQTDQSATAQEDAVNPNDTSEEFQQDQSEKSQNEEIKHQISQDATDQAQPDQSIEQQEQQNIQENATQPIESVLQQLTSAATVVNTSKEATTISLAGSDFVLQPGQQLPPEIQEMIAKGLPIDMSNFEFVVDEDQHNTAAANPQIQNVSQIKATTIESSNVNTIEQGEEQQKNGIFVQVVTACPGEFDDGEFPLIPITQDQRLNNSDPYIASKSFFLSQYINYIQSGGKVSLMKRNSQQQTMQLGRSILLNNQMDNKFKRKRVLDLEDEDDLAWKMNDPKRQRAKQQRMNFVSPNVKGFSQHDLMKLHHATTNSQFIFEMPVAYIMQNEPHNYQKGDFVVDKKDAYQSNFPMWRIESSKLLQKFEPFIENNLYLHKSASVYSSWSGDIRTNFRAVMADILSTQSAPIGRKQEIVVKVHDKYIPKPADEKLEQNALMQFFNIYVHVLLNQVFEPAYLTAIKQQNVDYYLEPMTQIDQLIAEAKQGVLLECNWNSLFQVALETWSTYTFGPLRSMDVRQQCQAISSGGPAVKVVKFYGQNYSAETLQADQDVTIGSNRVVEFLVGKTAMANLGVYHALHHFKYLLFRRCHDEAVFQVSTQKKSSSDVPDICIQNRIWVQQMFQDLKGLLDRYIIIKTEEESAENSNGQ